MSNATLNLVDHLVTQGRKFQFLGRAAEAHDTLTRLAGFRDLPAAVAEETQVRLAELALRAKAHDRARRHLAAALALAPDNARYHHLMATTLEADEDGDLDKALLHYREALRLDPDNATCQSEFGSLAVYLGQLDDGMGALRRAAALAPDNATILRRVLEAMCEAGETEEAEQVARAARFRNPRDPRFRDLWNDFQFQRIHQAQQRWGTPGLPFDPSLNDPILLPFRSAS